MKTAMLQALFGEKNLIEIKKKKVNIPCHSVGTCGLKISVALFFSYVTLVGAAHIQLSQ